MLTPIDDAPCHAIKEENPKPTTRTKVFLVTLLLDPISGHLDTTKILDKSVHFLAPPCYPTKVAAP